MPAKFKHFLAACALLTAAASIYYMSRLPRADVPPPGTVLTANDWGSRRSPPPPKDPAAEAADPSRFLAEGAYSDGGVLVAGGNIAAPATGEEPLQAAEARVEEAANTATSGKRAAARPAAGRTAQKMQKPGPDGGGAAATPLPQLAVVQGGASHTIAQKATKPGGKSAAFAKKTAPRLQQKTAVPAKVKAVYERGKTASPGDLTEQEVDEILEGISSTTDPDEGEIEMLIAMVNDGVKFTEAQSGVLQNIRDKDEGKIQDGLDRAANMHIVIPPQLKRGSYWPAKGGVSQKFGPTDWKIYSGLTYNGVWYPHFHRGLDVAAPLNAPIYAFDAGQVAEVGGTRSTGVYVVLAHPDSFATSYVHMPVGGPTVSPGQYVSAGQVIGSIGMTGMTTGPHVHFTVRQGGKYIDPLSVLP